jgi:rhodanese-related sulfurtransferase
MLEQFMTLYDGKEVIIYCWSGGRSASASQLLVNNGFNGTIYNMLGGVSAWKDALYPTLGGGITNITVEEGYELLTDTANGIQKPIDVRTYEEWLTGYIKTPYPENASLHPLSDLQDGEKLQDFLEIYDGRELIMYCHSGGRSLLASEILIENQFTGTVYNMLGGIVAWKIADYPIKTLEPDLDASGSLTWNKVDPGSIVQTSMSLENIGESGSNLDWSIESYPNWGNWSFSSLNGNDLPTDETFTVFVNITSPDATGTEYTGEIKIVNMENASDFTILPVYLKTPRNRAVFNSNLIRLFRLIPIAFPMIKYFLS